MLCWREELKPYWPICKIVVTEIEAKPKQFLLLYQTQKEGNAWNSDLDLLPLSV